MPAADRGAAPPLVAVVGLKKSGKTTTVVKLVAELRRRGHRVMTIKHGHHFDLDREGTDSWRHRDAGAERVVLAGPDGMAVMGGWPDASPAGPEALAARWLADADVVVVEGFKAAPVPRIEVFRMAAHPEPLYAPDVPGADLWIGAVTDHPDFARTVPFPVFDAGAPDLGASLADLVEREVMGRA